MSVMELLCAIMFMLILFPLVSVMISAIIEIYFKRKEKHIDWTIERFKKK